MKKLIAFSILFQLFNLCLAQDKRIPVQINNALQFKIIGELGEEMGDTFTVRGIIVQGPYKGGGGGPNLLVQLIRDSSIQKHLQIPVSPYFGEFGRNRLPKLENGATYRFRVFETGGYTGRPADAYKEVDISLQTSGFYFLNRLIVIFGEKIDSIEWSPANFLGQNALLSGIAKNENDIAIIQTSSWKLRLIGSAKWKDAEVGKLAEVYGMIRETKTKDTYDAENGRARLVRLEDQLGKTVKLRGTALSMNGDWWFNYRGIEMYVENMSELVGQKGENHFRSMEITGILEQAELPRVDRQSSNDPEPKMYYIIRKASWIPIPELLALERYDQR